MTIEDLLIYASLLCSSEGHPRPSINVATDASNIKPVNMTKISYLYHSSKTCISKNFIDFSNKGDKIYEKINKFASQHTSFRSKNPQKFNKNHEM